MKRLPRLHSCYERDPPFARASCSSQIALRYPKPGRALPVRSANFDSNYSGSRNPAFRRSTRWNRALHVKRASFRSVALQRGYVTPGHTQFSSLIEPHLTDPTLALAYQAAMSARETAHRLICESLVQLAFYGQTVQYICQRTHYFSAGYI